LAVAPETPATRAPEGVTGVSAVLRGELNPRAKSTEAVEYEFAFAPSGSECTGGLVAPEPAEPVTGAPGEIVSREVTGLEPDRTYTVCVVAIRESEVSYGPSVSFKTLPVSPAVVSESSSPGLDEARLEALVNAENEVALCVFEYGPTSSYGTSVPCEPAIIEGFGAQGVGSTIVGLSPGSMYHYRVVLTNAGDEKSFGSGQVFTTVALQAPAVEAESSRVTPFEATLEATVNPEYQETTCKIEYGSEPGLPVAGTTVVPCSPSLFNGPSGVGVSFVLTGLAPGHDYYYRFVAVDRTGRAEGAIETAKTLVLQAPVVESESVPGVTPFEANVETVVDPEYQDASCMVEYSIEEAKVTGGTGTKVACNPADLGSGGGGAGAAATLSGLTAKTTYYYRVRATNNSGTTPGTVEHFETLAATAPVIEAEGVSGVGPFGATLEAVINPSFQATTCSFEYSSEESKLTSHTATKVACTEPLGAGGGGVGVPLPVTGLEHSKTYYYRVTAKNTTGTSEGTIEHFETTAPERPLIEGEAANAVTHTTATLEASVNPEFQATTWQFEYATTESVLLKSEGTVVKGAPPAADLTGGTGVTVTAPVTGLAPAAVYYYRVVAANTTGAAFEPLTVSRFTTASIPTATTGGPEGVTATTASVTGSVNPEGLPTTYSFEYGRTQSYGQHTTPVELPAGASTAPVAANITGLQPGVTYHYRITAANSNGTQTTLGEDETLTTQTATATPPVLSGVTVTATSPNSAVITGVLDPRGTVTHYELQAGTTPGVLGPQASGQASTTTSLALTATALAPSTIYYYRLTATSLEGTTEAQGTFTTSTAPTTPPTIEQPTTPPLLTTPNTSFPTTEKTTKPTAPLTNQQKLTKALHACHKTKNKTKRVKCEKQAHHNYPTKPKKKPSG
jgi:phosphodiesterase/alkaline phosphatase D-like protein